jgi:hypothetical protein
MKPIAPVYTLRGVSSRCAMISMVPALGAPVMEAGGNRAPNTSAREAVVLASTVDVICQSVE